MSTEGQEPKTTEERITSLEDGMGTILDMLEGLTKKVTEVDKKAVKKSSGLFGGKRTKTAIKDTTNGKIYASKAQMGKVMAKEFGLDPGNNFVYYQIIAKAPERFVDASEEEATKAWEAEKAQIEKDRAEAQTKLDAEEAAKKVEEAATKKAEEAKGQKKG